MRPEGATLSDLTAASGWLPHTTRADAVLELPKKKARPVGGLPEVGLGLQAVDRRRDQVGVVLQEGDVVLVEARPAGGNGAARSADRRTPRVKSPNLGRPPWRRYIRTKSA